MLSTQSRVKGTKYKITNLIEELIAMQKEGVEYIDMDTINIGFMNIETNDESESVKETWIEYVEYKIIGA